MVFKMGDTEFSCPIARTTYSFSEKEYMIEIIFNTMEDANRVISVDFDGTILIYINYDDFKAGKPVRTYRNCSLTYLAEELSDERIEFKLVLRSTDVQS